LKSIWRQGELGGEEEIAKFNAKVTLATLRDG
jgi:hypothetical protein